MPDSYKYPWLDQLIFSISLKQIIKILYKNVNSMVDFIRINDDMVDIFRNN